MWYYAVCVILILFSFAEYQFNTKVLKKSPNFYL